MLHEPFFWGGIFVNSMNEVILFLSKQGRVKVDKTPIEKIILGFLGGAFVGVGYLSYVLVAGSFPGMSGHLIGSFLFPIGLTLILMVGAELITGNMTVVSLAMFNKEVSVKEMLINWVWITLGNALGAMTIALVFGVYLDMLAPYSDFINNLAMSKVTPSLMQVFVSGVGCNWIVGLAIWLFNVMQDGFAKLVGAWIPTAIFVLLSFQHSVANVFVFSASFAYGGIDLQSALINFCASYLGNAVGGLVFVSLIYTLVNNQAKKNLAK